MKVGLLGYGFFGQRVARAIARVAELAVIADPHHGHNSEALNEWAKWGTHITTSHEHALRVCDAVWVATPVPSHGALVEEALAAGCHVLCEKPFVLDVEEAERLARLAQAADCALMVGHLSLYMEEHATLRALAPKASEISMKRWNTTSSISDESVLWGLGPHDVASVIDVWGQPDMIGCEGTRHRAVAGLGWSDGRTAKVDLDWLALNRWRHVEVDGLTVVDSLAQGPDPKQKEPLLAEAEAFMALCRERDGRLAKAEEAVAVTRTLHRLHDAILVSWTR